MLVVISKINLKLIFDSVQIDDDYKQKKSSSS